MNNDSILKTFIVAGALCIVCSVVVSAAAVALKPIQERNKLLDKQVNVLRAAGLVKPNENPSFQKVNTLFADIKPVVIDIMTGRELTDVKPESVDVRAEAADKERNIELNGNDIAKIGAIAKRAVVYECRENGKVRRYVFPIYGKGLWSTMYGFIALEADLNTVASINFYEHGETPGLGGEIANPAWQKKWVGKVVFHGNASEPTLKILKTGLINDRDDKIDGIAGSTLTGNGVENAVHFWLGKLGYGPYITRLKTSLTPQPKP